jgi:hypothetical protein
MVYYRMFNKKKGEKNMNTKKELGRRYADLRSDIKSYTNDSYDDQFTFEHILQTYVPAKVLKVWIARSEEELKQHEQNEERA